MRIQLVINGITSRTFIYHPPAVQALNRTGWFKPIKEGSDAGPVQRLTNRLSGRSLAILDKAVWFICTARNAIVVVVCLVIAMVMDPEGHNCKTHPDLCVFSLTGNGNF